MKGAASKAITANNMAMKTRYTTVESEWSASYASLAKPSQIKGDITPFSQALSGKNWGISRAHDGLLPTPLKCSLLNKASWSRNSQATTNMVVTLNPEMTALMKRGLIAG
jgi:hypothetical protein